MGIQVVEKQRNGPARILFVASVFSPWHGLDLLLEVVAGV